MIIKLFLDLDKVTDWYGASPDAAPVETDNVHVFFTEPQFNREIYSPLLNKYFYDQVDDYCGALLGPYDDDYLDAEQCRKLSKWLEGQIANPPDKRLPPLYRKIKKFADKAVQLNTGLDIECQW